MVVVDGRSRSAVLGYASSPVARQPSRSVGPPAPLAALFVHCPSVVLRVRTSCARIGTCSCSCDNCDPIAIVVLLQPFSRPSAGCKTRPRVANKGHITSGPAAVALQQQAQRHRQTAYRAKITYSVCRHGVVSKRGPSGHFFSRNRDDGEVLTEPLRRIPLGETTSTAPPRRAPRLTWASRRVPHKPPHCMHSRPGTPPPDPADRILAPWQSRVPCIPLRIFPAPPHAPGHCRG